MSFTDEVVMSRPTKDPLRLVANTLFFLSNTRGWVRILHVPSTAQFNYISPEIYTVVTCLSIRRSSLDASVGARRRGIRRLGPDSLLGWDGHSGLRVSRGERLARRPVLVRK